MIVEQTAYEMPNDAKVVLKMEDLKLHSNGVFSNVYSGVLKEPYEKKIAIKKTWPEKYDRNFEFIFLTGREREKNPFVIQMLFAFSHDYGNKLCESYVFDFMSDTLHTALKRKLNEMDIRLYSWQMFAGLSYLEDHLVIHRDLKPVNILVDHTQGTLKIGDFGSSKVYQKGKLNASYQVTRFYRPPELLMKASDYDMTIDIWSAGCIVGEMIRKNVLFPGRDGYHQMKLIVRCFGCPTESEMRAMRAAEKVGGDLITIKPYSLSKLLPEATVEMIQFMNRVLVYHPQKRLRGRTCLKDEFFAPLFAQGAVRTTTNQPINKIITPEMYKAALEDEDVNKTKRLCVFTWASKSKVEMSIPICEKSTSYEGLHVRRSTLLPREQRMAREQKSNENSREERSKDGKLMPSSENRLPLRGQDKSRFFFYNIIRI